VTPRLFRPQSESLALYSNLDKLQRRSVPKKGHRHGEPTETKGILSAFFKPSLSRDQQSAIDACHELLASGRPVSEVLEELRRVGKRGSVSNATLAIELAEMCSQFDETRHENGSWAPSAPISESSPDMAASSRSKFRRVIWEGFVGSIAAGLVTFGRSSCSCAGC